MGFYNQPIFHLGCLIGVREILLFTCAKVEDESGNDFSGKYFNSLVLTSCSAWTQ